MGAMRRFIVLTIVAMVSYLACLGAADVPQMMNFQGQFSSGSITLDFYISSGATTGMRLPTSSPWHETLSTSTADGYISYLLGSQSAIPKSIFTDSSTIRYLEIVENSSSQFMQLVSVPFAYRASFSDNAMYAESLAGGATISGDLNVSGLVSMSSVTINSAILRSGSTAYGTNANTHICLGANSITGDVNNFSYCTISGGYGNYAKGAYSFIGGGLNNSAGCYGWSGINTVIGGGSSNVAKDEYSAILGGWNNSNEGYCSAIGGGRNNTITYSSPENGYYSTIPGGRDNGITGSYCFAAGRRAKAQSEGVFALSDSQDADFVVNSDNVFGSRFSGGYWFTGGNVGVGTTSPQYKLQVNGQFSSGNYSIFTSSSLVGVKEIIFQDGTTQNTANIQWSATGNDIYRSVGNVGIGVPNPSAKLTFDGGLLRYGSSMLGSAANTHICLGMESTTGRTTGYNGQYCTITGGYCNQATSDFAVVDGGHQNIASGYSSRVLGGEYNTAAGDHSCAIGTKAQANALGSFALTDSQWSYFTVNSTDTFGARFQGGYWLTGGNVGIGITPSSSTLTVNGTILAISSITAGAFVGNGAGLTNLPVPGNMVTVDSIQTITAQKIFQNSVGIGTASPRTTLDVNGGITAVSSITASGGFYGKASGLTDLPVSTNVVTTDTTQNISGNKTFTGITFGVVPTGTVLPYIVSISTMPAGFLYCNGQVVSRSTYATLFALIGTAFGSGNGSTTFNLPDMRGMFLRGVDDGRGYDSEANRVIGSTETDTLQGHKHSVQAQVVSVSNVYLPFTPTACPLGDGNTGVPISDGMNGTPRTSKETRPQNIAIAYIIKY